MVESDPAVLAALSPEVSVLVRGLGLIVLMLLAGVAVVVVRKRLRATRRGIEAEAASGGFTMERLEALYRGGQLSDEEFRRLRRQVLKLQEAGNPPVSGSSSPPADDDGNAVDAHPGS